MTRPQGSLRPTPPAVPAAFACFGLVLGSAIRPVTLWLGVTAPVVSWGQVLGLAFLAGLLAVTAWVTWRELRVRGLWLEPHRAMNRLVMAKASIIAGALLAGGFGGYAVSWLAVWMDTGLDSAQDRLVRSALAALLGLVITGVAILLERACRVRDGDDADLA